jgi:hypothetical protein
LSAAAGEFKEAKPAADPAAEAEAERKAIDATLTGSGAAGAAGSGQNRAGTPDGQKPGGRPAGASPGQPGAGFDRKAALERRKQTPLEDMRTLDGKLVFDDDELKFWKALKSRGNRKLSKEDQKRASTLQDRKDAWVSRMADYDQEQHEKAQAKAAADLGTKVTGSIIDKLDGTEPWKGVNKLVELLVSAELVPGYAEAMKLEPKEIATLAEPTKLVIEKHRLWLEQFASVMSAEAYLFGSVVVVFGPHLLATFMLWKASREEKPKPKPEAAPAQ